MSQLSEFRSATAGALSTLAALVSVMQGCHCPSSDEASPGPVLVEEPTNEGPCPHPYLPLIKGAGWSYQLGEDPSRATRAELRVMELEKQGRGVIAKVRRTVGPSVTTVTAVCGTEGVSFLAFFVPLGPPLPAKLNFSPRVTKRAGALLAPAVQLKSGESWDYQMIAQTRNPGGKVLTMESEWAVKVQYAGRQEITVPAGRYDAVQIKLHVSVHHRPPAEQDITFSDRIMDPPSMGFTYSLAKGVGVVLIEGDEVKGQPSKRAYWALTGVHHPGGEP